MKKFTICATGHRPEKLPGGYDVSHQDYNGIREVIRRCLSYYCQQHGAIRVISGMALGIDTIWALEAIAMKKEGYSIELEAAIPNPQQTSPWRDESRKQWLDILAECDSFHISSEVYTGRCMQQRNEYMVHQSDVIMAFWDGTSGGTFNCVEYAFRLKKDMWSIHPRSLKRGRVTQEMINTGFAHAQQQKAKGKKAAV